ncbi:conserved hypothetical protein [Coccidioides posadasii str. Silveira]|uniref:Uncharacterized protein n=2 Tax=Coccidioides posadasii (strain RMSCC 757 / Silveira) TaxID=443226 RepID=E9D2B6_COCPS|nr:conserved hypothetical protein [Coccidioides posadasii str. Silveira]
MQSLWFRSAPPTCTCRCISCLSTGSNAVSNRAAAAASRRRLLLGNSITMFYSTIFVTAVMLDTKSKGKRRLEREKEIEAVKAEVREMKEEEHRILESLARRWRPLQRSFRSARRQYSTAASPVAEYERYRSMASQSTKELYEDAPEIPSQTIPENEDEQEPFEGAPEITPTRKRAIRLLAMRMLGIRLLLRPSIAHTYGTESKTRVHNPKPVNLSVDELLEKLEVVQRRLMQIKFSSKAYYGDVCIDINLDDHGRLLQTRNAASYKLLSLFNFYESGSISVDHLISEVARILIAAEEPLSPRGVETLISKFARARMNDVVKMAMDSLFKNSFPLTIPVIVSSLSWFSKARDLSGFENFLDLLRTPDPFVDMPLRWHSTNIGGVEIAIPPSSTPSPFVLNSLIACALQFDQPHKADAWLDVLRAMGFSDTIPTLGAYLRYYSLRADWTKGRHVLMRAVFYLLSSRNHPRHEIERLILYMIILCETCGRKQIADLIVDAAVSSGVRWEHSTSSRDSRPALLWAVQKWRDASIDSVDSVGDLSPGERYFQFARKIEPGIRRVVEEFLPEDDLTQQRMRLQESFNMKYYKLITNFGDSPSRHTSTVKDPIDEFESTKTELRRLRGVVSLQGAVIAKLEASISSPPRTHGRAPWHTKSSIHARTQDNMANREFGGFPNNLRGNRYRLGSILNRGGFARNNKEENQTASVDIRDGTEVPR